MKKKDTNIKKILIELNNGEVVEVISSAEAVKFVKHISTLTQRRRQKTYTEGADFWQLSPLVFLYNKSSVIDMKDRRYKDA